MTNITAGRVPEVGFRSHLTGQVDWFVNTYGVILCQRQLFFASNYMVSSN